jgi:NAD(P)-dependent dehydrogenase (short-subunit alcohol dehydrogenase family)
VAGDLAEPATALEIARATSAGGGLDVLVHTAGLSPSLAGWEAIVEVNLVATVRLLDALEPQLQRGAAAVLIASMAGHIFDSTAEIDAVLDTVAEPGLAARLEPHLRRMTNAGGPGDLAASAYGATKRAVLRLCEQRAVTWGKRGARIVSVSPGLIATPMGRKEAAENEAAAALLRATPADRWGTPLDIAAAVEFLASDQAGFISGCDLRVDGGLTGGLRHGLSPA